MKNEVKNTDLAFNRTEDSLLFSYLNSFPSPFYVIDVKDYSVKMANAAACAGDLPEKITCYALTHKLSKPCGSVGLPCPVEQVKKTKKPVVVEHTHFIGEKSRIVEIHAYPIFDEKQNVVEMMESCLDITERKNLEKKLSHDRNLLRTLFDSHPDFIYFKDSEARFHRVSNRFCDLLGLNKEDIVGKTDLDLFPRDVAEKTYREDLHVIKTGTPLINKEEYAKGVWVLTTKIPWFDMEGNIIGLFGISRDITLHKKAEEIQLNAEKKYRDIFEKAVVGFFQTTPDGRFLSVNPFLAKMLGYSSPKELIRDRKDIKNQGYVLPQRRDEFKKQMEKKGRIKNFEFQVYDRRGGKIWLSENVRVVKDSQGKILYYEGTVLDITKQKLAEDKLNKYTENLEQRVIERTLDLNKALHNAEEARDNIDTILKSVADGVIVTDLDGNVILMNTAAENLFGVKLKKVSNRPLSVVLQKKALKNRFMNFFAGGNFLNQFDFELPDEETKSFRVIRARTSARKDKTNETVGIVTILSDVTYEHEVDRMKTEFISSAAHELKTPLTVIRGFSELLLSKDNIDNEEKDMFLTYINHQSKNLVAIIDDLFIISRIESEKKIILDKVPLDIVLIIKETVAQFEKRSPDKKYKMDLPFKHLKLNVDDEKVRRALTNILSNAVKFSPEGSIIKIGAVLADGVCQISVEDQGIGMNPDQAEKIFDKYYKADSSSSALEGAGLGMTIAKYIIEAHGGKIWVESELDKGTAVRFTIPEKKR